MSTYIRLIISFFLISFLIAKTDLTQLVAAVFSMKPMYILIAICIVILDRATAISRWRLLLHAKGFTISFFKAAWFCYVSDFAGLFLPTSVGADATRAVNFGRYASNHTDAVSSSFFDRFISMAALLIMVLGGLFLSQTLSSNKNAIIAILVTTVFFAVTVALLYNRKLSGKIVNVLGFIKLSGLKKKLTPLYDSLSEYIKNKKLIASALSLSFLIQVLRILTIYFIGLSLNVRLSFLQYLMFVPMILFVTALPISIEGIGVREYAFIYFFTKFGISNHQAITTSLVFCGLGIFSSLTGGVIYMLHGLPKKHKL